MATGQGKELIAALQAAGSKVAVVAVLWTWLEENLPELGGYRQKSPEIVEAAERRGTYSGITDVDWVPFEQDPAMAAAELLAWIEQSIDPAWPLMVAAKSFGGEEVLVTLRANEFVEKASGVEEPPTAHEHPSLTTLAPSIVVSPIKVKGAWLKGELAEGHVWEATLKPLRTQLTKSKPKIQVHLDTLGSPGLSNWVQRKGKGRRGHFGKIREPDRLACVEAACEAVRRAAVRGTATILVLPELGVDETALEAIKDELRRLEDGRPCLTVVGIRHQRAKRKPMRAGWVNEAVVLAPNGAELWRHRKLKAAGSTKPAGGYDEYLEDILVGDTLRVFQTPIGNLAVSICLDCFGEGSRERLSESPASVILVPSLSKSATPHRTSLNQLVNKLYAIAFVCNRSPFVKEGAGHWNGEEGRSFWALPVRGSITPPAKADPENDHPSFVFDLSDPLAKKKGG
jgi:predicted amidohydrolase